MVEPRIWLTNSKTRRKEPFEPLDPANVRMYLCGPTVYDRAHLGNARPVVVFDVLYRLLRYKYGQERVTYVRNFTDVDDKINARAAETGRPIRDITDETIRWYHEDMDALGALRPDHEPRATDYIPQMVAMIGTLVARGHAYQAEGHVLFDVRSYPAYGRLSGRSVDDMIAGARVEIAPFKRDPMDFVLWKPSSGGEPGWDSPWGFGRPGWHIECSAMSAALLGESFDIHGGGLDLMFPHHENEIAQSCCAHPEADFARVWLHNEMLQVEGKKMSKSLGNFFTVRDLLEQGVPGEVIRYVMLMTHYRKPMDWTAEKVRQAERHLTSWFVGLHSHGYDRKMVELLQANGVWRPDAIFVAALADDMNTPAAIARLHSMQKGASAVELPSFAASLELAGLVIDWDNLASVARMGVSSVGEHPASDRVASLLLDRQEAKRIRDFATADAIRKRVTAAGVRVTDEPGGSYSFEILPSFDERLLDLDAK